MPIFEVPRNRVDLDAFAIPDAESFVGWANYIKGMTFSNRPFLKAEGSPRSLWG